MLLISCQLMLMVKWTEWKLKELRVTLVTAIINICMIHGSEHFIDQKIRAHTAPTVIEKPSEATDEAAGFKRRLKAKCISCDKPVGILPTP